MKFATAVKPVTVTEFTTKAKFATKREIVGVDTDKRLR
jgi:hypothetical protein